MFPRGLRPRTPSASGSLAVARPPCARCARPSPGQTQQAFGGDVALDLVGAGVDRTRQRELVALRPRSFELGLGTEEVERELVQVDVELAPPDLVDGRLGPEGAPFAQARDRV